MLTFYNMCVKKLKALQQPLEQKGGQMQTGLALCEGH